MVQDEPMTNRAQDMLLDFLREHDAACPVCGYNLRALTRPICPECGNELVLTVGAARLRLGWLLAAVAPGFFSGIAAFFVLVMIVIHLVMLGSTWKIIAIVDVFGWCSALFTFMLLRKRSRFGHRQRGRNRQAMLEPCQRIFGIATARNQGAQTIAHFVRIDPLPHRDHST